MLLLEGLIEVEGILEVEGLVEVEAEVEGPLMVQELLEELEVLVVVVERMVLTVLQEVVIMLGFEVVGEPSLLGLVFAFLLIKY